MEIFKCAHSKIIPIKDLKPHPKNPNKHPKSQIDRLAKVIAYQGQRAPIVVSKRSGFITKGHGRREALILLGWNKAAVDFQDYDSEDQEYADIVADNAIASWAELQFEMINIEVPNLGPNFNIDLLGIKNFVLDANDKEFDPDAIDDDEKQKDLAFLECPHCGEQFEKSQAKKIKL